MEKAALLHIGYTNLKCVGSRANILYLCTNIYIWRGNVHKYNWNYKYNVRKYNLKTTN